MALVVIGFVFAASGVAYAFFSAAGTGTYGLATAGQLTSLASFGAAATSSSAVTLTWSAPGAPPPGAYSYVLSGTLGTGGTCSASMSTTTTTCTIDGLPPSTSQTWTLGVRFHTWLSPTTQASATTEVRTPSLCGVGGIQTWSGPATKHVTYPGCVKPTDLLVLVLARSHNNTASCPAGWGTPQATGTAKTSKSKGVHAFLEVCSTVYASGTYVTLTVKGTAQRGSSAEIAAFSGVTTTTPFETTPTTTKAFASATAFNARTFAAPGFTTTTPGDLALSVVMQNSDTATIPTLALKSGTTRGFLAQPSGGMQTTQSDALTLATKAISRPGAVTFPTWTGPTYPTNAWIGVSLALRADPPPSKGAPTVTGLSQAQGSLLGGTPVTITGTEFTPGTTVEFGRTAAESVVVESVTSIVATAPAHVAGQVDVRVTNAKGTSRAARAGRFTYRTTTPTTPATDSRTSTTGTAASASPEGPTTSPGPLPQSTATALAPSVTRLAPATGPTEGGTTVTITGTAFTSTTTVSFGTTAATTVTVTGPTLLTVVSPVHAQGPVYVTVTTPSGTSALSAADQFTYTSTPAGAG